MTKYLTKYEVRWAIIFSFIVLLWTAFEYEMGWHDKLIQYHKYYTFLFILPATLCYIAFILDKRAHRFKRRFKFKHAFLSGLGLTLLIVLFNIPTQALIHFLVSPDFVSNAQHHLIETGNLQEHQVYNWVTSLNLSLLMSILYLFFGIFISIILAIIFKRKSSRRKRKRK